MKRLPRFDLLDERPAPQPGRWLLALGLLALAGFAAAPAARSRLQERLVGPGTTQAPAAASPGSAGRDAAAHLPDRSAAWAELFAIRSTHGQGSVELLALKPDLDAGRLHLVAQAVDLPTMLAWLHDLESDSRLGGVALTHHEWREASASTAPPTALRFEIEARWPVPVSAPQTQALPTGSAAGRPARSACADAVQLNACG